MVGCFCFCKLNHRKAEEAFLAIFYFSLRLPSMCTSPMILEVFFKKRKKQEILKMLSVLFFASTPDLSVEQTPIKVTYA